MIGQETAPRELLAKGSDASLPREMIAFAAERPMDLEMGAATGLAHAAQIAQMLGRRLSNWIESQGGALP